jgi:hypothetical protein
MMHCQNKGEEMGQFVKDDIEMGKGWMFYACGDRKYAS